jgi:endonuclease/exonuclease/phosphatase family metal-dependent hydrolase
VQENLLDGVRARLEHLKEAAGFAELWFDPMGPDLEDGTFVGGGLAILSRWAIDVRFVRLARGAGPDGFARKGLAAAKVVLPSGRVIHVVNTHLQADDPNVPQAMCRVARAAQLAGLSQSLAALRDSGAPTVLCGDMNVAHGTDEYDDMRRALGGKLLDLAAEAGLSTYDVDRNDLAATFHPGGPGRALFDYIMTSHGSFEAREIRTILDEPLREDVLGCPPSYAARPFPSDHFGVGVTLDLIDS